MGEKVDREEQLKQELKARAHLRRLDQRRQKSLITVANAVHNKYNKLVESYVAQLDPTVAAALQAPEEVEATDITEGGD